MPFLGDDDGFSDDASDILAAPLERRRDVKPEKTGVVDMGGDVDNAEGDEADMVEKYPGSVDGMPTCALIYNLQSI